MARALRLVVNPADTDQRYVLWSNGRIQPLGSALPVPQTEAVFGSSIAPNAPTFYTAAPLEPAIALQITDWAFPSGYVLDIFGGVYEFGAAAAIPGTPPPNYFFTNPYFGFVYDFEMSPSQDGLGYFLQLNGDVIAFGTGIPAITHTNFLAPPFYALQLEMDWASKRYWVMDNYGRVFGLNGGNDVPVGVNAPLTQFFDGAGQGFRLYDKSADPVGWMVDRYGFVNSLGGAADATGFQHLQVRIFTDVDIIDDGTGLNPQRLAQLNEQGQVFEWITSTAPVVTVLKPLDPTTDTTRPRVEIGYADAENDALTLAEVRVITDAVYLAATTNEVQRITITGTPTGGFFKLTFDGHTTADIARNANAATVQAALELLPNIGTGGVTCAGGALPGAFVTVTFTGRMAGWNWPQMTASNTFTGGSSPAIAITTTTPGVGIDPATAIAVFETTWTDRVLRSVQVDEDLANDTYRAFARVTDSSGLVSSWVYRQWTENVTPLDAPTVVVTSLDGLDGISIDIAVGSPPVTNGRFALQYQDADSDTWEFVRDGYGIVPDGSNEATLVDYEARFGVERTYRAKHYVYDADGDIWVGSAWSATDADTLGPRDIWTLTNPFDSDAGGIVDVNPDFSLDRSIVGGAFQPDGRDDPIVLIDGKPKTPVGSLRLWELSTSMRVELDELFEAQVPVLLRDPFGRAFYIMAIGSVKQSFVHASPTAGEVTSVRDAHELSASVQGVRRPSAAPLTGPLAG